MSKYVLVLVLMAATMPSYAQEVNAPYAKIVTSVPVLTPDDAAKLNAALKNLELERENARLRLRVAELELEKIATPLRREGFTLNYNSAAGAWEYVPTPVQKK